MNHIHLRNGAVAVRPMTEADAPHLLKWMTDPAVLEWYEGRDQVFTMERVLEDFYEEEPYDKRQCIVEYEGRPVGYIQIYRLDEELCEEYEYPHPERLVFAIDQFLGEPDCWNRRIGRTFITLIVKHLTETEGAHSVVLDPHVSNPRAVRCYEACGFVKVKLLPKHELHEGVWEDCWLMEYKA